MAQIVNIISGCKPAPMACSNRVHSIPSCSSATSPRDTRSCSQIAHLRNRAVRSRALSGCLCQLRRSRTAARRSFIVNRSQTDAVVTDLVWQTAAPKGISEAWQLSGTDPKAVNSWKNLNNITAQKIAAPRISDGKVTLNLPPLSFTALSVG